jgi:hypothetical protein
MFLEKFMNARGIERAERCVLMTYLSILVVALCRLQHGGMRRLIECEVLQLG